MLRTPYEQPLFIKYTELEQLGEALDITLENSTRMVLNDYVFKKSDLFKTSKALI